MASDGGEASCLCVRFPLLADIKARGRFRPIADIRHIVDGGSVKHSSLWCLAAALLASSTAPSLALARPVSVCPRPATQNDVLPYSARQFPSLQPTFVIRQAVAKVQACRPTHPVVGGRSQVRFEDARAAGGGRMLLRFQVIGLSDMYLIYVANRGGRLLKAYVDGP
jgi:hypothetical protein